MPGKILLTDHPWPDVEIETAALTAAGFELIAGPIETPAAQYVESMVERHDPVAIMTCWAQVSASVIARPTALGIVARLGVGLDNIDVAAATRRGAWVTNVPDYCVEEVSDHAIAMMLSLWRGLNAMDRSVKAGRWDPASARLDRVSEKTIGIVGYGNTGSVTARKMAQGFRCRVLVNSPSLLRQHAVGEQIAERVVVADLAAIQQAADAIVLHAPLTAQTKHLANDAFFAGLARRPLLINVSRGGLVDNDALIRALQAGRIAAAGLDVIEGEPSPPATVTSRSDVIATPHVAFSSAASLLELRQRCTQEVLRVLSGEAPRHPCNRPASQGQV